MKATENQKREVLRFFDEIADRLERALRLYVTKAGLLMSKSDLRKSGEFARYQKARMDWKEAMTKVSKGKGQ